MNSVDTTNPNQLLAKQNASNTQVLAKERKNNLEKNSPQETDSPEITAKKQELENLIHQEALDSPELEQISEEENLSPENSEKVESPEEGFIDKLLKVMTYGNFGVNAVSIALSSLALKNDGLQDHAKKAEKVGLFVNKLQAITLGSGFINEARKTKNIFLLITGFAQALKLPSGYNRLFRLAGIPSALDQLPAAINPITGKKTYESFNESWKMGTKVIKDVLQEFTSAPIKFLKYLDPKSEDATKPLVPASMFMAAGALLSNIFDIPALGPLRKPLTALGSLPRHGGGFVGDYSLLMDKKNHFNRKAGFLYSIGTAADYLGLLANEKVGHIMHQMSYMFFPLAEMLLIKGSSHEDTESPAPTNPAMELAAVPA